MTKKHAKLLTRVETAKRLGVAVQTLADWAHYGRFGLRYIRVGGCIRYGEDELDRWLECNTVDPTESRKVNAQ